MIGKHFPEKKSNGLRLVIILGLIVILPLVMSACAQPAREAPAEVA